MVTNSSRDTEDGCSFMHEYFDGVCPHCHRSIEHGNPTHERCDAARPGRRWRISTMAAAMQNGDEWTKWKLLNVFLLEADGPNLADALPIFRLALGCGSEFTRVSAERALFQHGQELNVSEIPAWRSFQSQVPDDFALRLVAAGLEFGIAEDYVTNEALTGHILWLVEHHPKSFFARHSYQYFDKTERPVWYRAACKLWQQQLGAIPADLGVWRSAGMFYRAHDFATAEELYLRICEAEPENLCSYTDLAHL